MTSFLTSGIGQRWKTAFVFPMLSHLKWTRKTTGKIAQQLQRLDIQVCANTVSRLLYDMGYSLRVNHKTLESGNKNPPPRRVRNRQFKWVRLFWNEVKIL